MQGNSSTQRIKVKRLFYFYLPIVRARLTFWNWSFFNHQMLSKLYVLEKLENIKGLFKKLFSSFWKRFLTELEGGKSAGGNRPPCMITGDRGEAGVHNTCATGIIVNKSTKTITYFWRGRETTNTTDNDCTETQFIFLYLYRNKKRYNNSFASYKKNKGRNLMRQWNYNGQKWTRLLNKRK